MDFPAELYRVIFITTRLSILKTEKSRCVVATLTACLLAVAASESISVRGVWSCPCAIALPVVREGGMRFVKGKGRPTITHALQMQ